MYKKYEDSALPCTLGAYLCYFGFYMHFMLVCTARRKQKDEDMRELGPTHFIGQITGAVVKIPYILVQVLPITSYVTLDN